MISETPARRNIGRDAVAGGLLCGAALLPWNLSCGLGIPDTDRHLVAVLGGATLLALGALALPPGRWRLVLTGPYLLLIAGFVVFDAAQTVRYGGTSQPPGGVGPGGWLGVAGALLAARPAPGTARILGYGSLLAAGLSVLVNLYWRIRYALPDASALTGLDRTHTAIIATALVYGLVAWAAIFVAGRWIIGGGRPARLATATLGASTVAAGTLVWALPVGRVIDGFHGIAQNTSTAGVGFEGFLVWAAAAALYRGRPGGHDVRLAAARKILLLIIVWCAGSALMRGTDLIVAISLDLPRSPYDSAAMAAFDVVSTVLAVWLRINLANAALPGAVIWSTGAILVGFTIARIVVGIGLAPRLPAAQRAAALAHPVYGNGLAQQITSTFDVVLCGLALYTLAVTIIAARGPKPQPAPRPRPQPRPRPEPKTPEPKTPEPKTPEPKTEALAAPQIFRSDAPTQQLPGGAPRIFRGTDQGSSNGSVIP